MLGVRKTKVRRSVEYYAKSSNTSDLHFIITHDILIRETSQQSWDLSWQQIIAERISPTVKKKDAVIFSRLRGFARHILQVRHLFPVQVKALLVDYFF